MKRSIIILLSLLLVFATSLDSFADNSTLPIDPSDNQSPALISATLESPTASANSANAIILVIQDDKNSMKFGGYEFEAPAGTGTLLLSQGYSQLISPPVLTNQIKQPNGIQETWRIAFKVPSVVGLWNGYRVDFFDMANNSVQFIDRTTAPCENLTRNKYPNQKSGSLDSTPCTFNLQLTVTPEVLSQNAKVTNPEYEDALLGLRTAQDRLRQAATQLNIKSVGKGLQDYIKTYAFYLNLKPGPLLPGREVLMFFPGRISELKVFTQRIIVISGKLSAQLAAIGKQVTIVCVKGKLTKKVTAIKPVCPKGYKKK